MSLRAAVWHMWHSFRMYKVIGVSIARTLVKQNCVDVIFSLIENKFFRTSFVSEQA